MHFKPFNNEQNPVDFEKLKTQLDQNITEDKLQTKIELGNKYGIETK